MLQYIRKEIQNFTKKKRIKRYLQTRQPWSAGYLDYRNLSIDDWLKKIDLIKAQQLNFNQLPEGFGLGLDERIVEYTWIFSQIPDKDLCFLDAGSTFNFDFIINQPILRNKKIYIQTYAPESDNFTHKGVSYVFEDLRAIPFKDNYFDLIISQSTIEHIDMDNSIYGYSPTKNKDAVIQKSYEFLKAIREMVRVLKPDGILLLTFPFGKFENHGFFQQFDTEMLTVLLNELNSIGQYVLTFFKYLPTGWSFSTQEDCIHNESYNPHTGRGKGTDGAAHCRSICCIRFQKNS